MIRVVTNAKARITQYYGDKNKHGGVDIGWVGGEGDNVYAHSDGVVTTVITGKPKNNNTTGNATYGNYVDIKHSNGYLTRYAHLATVDVKKGDKVVAGAKIGYIGESGNTFGKHLHFEIRTPKGKTIDPFPYLMTDLPSTATGVEYRVHVLDGDWLPWVSKVDETYEGYAGIYGKTIDGIQVKNRTYCAHIDNQWLEDVSKVDDTSYGYAGIYGKPIDGFQVQASTYRAHIKGGEWLPWVYKADNTSDGYAGLYGHEIDGIQIK